MIDVNLESTELTLKQPNELTFWLTNLGNEIVTNVRFSINLPVQIVPHSGLKKIEISQLNPGQKAKHTIKVVPKAEGKHIITSRNFSYRDGLGRGQRIKNLNLEITVIKKETVPPPPKANIDIQLQTTEIPLNQWEQLKGIVRNIGSIGIETIILKAVGRIESDQDTTVVSLPPESTSKVSLPPESTSNFNLNVHASESGSSVPFSIEAMYTDTFKRTERCIISKSLQVTIMETESSRPINMTFNAPVANAAGTAQTQTSTQYNYEQKQTLTEAASEIQQLLNQLAKSYPTRTEDEKQVFVTQFDSQVVQQKPRVQKILIEGGIELLKLICPPLGIPIEMGRTWLETAETNVREGKNN